MLSPPLLPLSPVWSHAAMGGARGCGVAVPSLSLIRVILILSCANSLSKKLVPLRNFVH